MISKFTAIATLAIMLCIGLSVSVTYFGMLGIQAMRVNYIYMTLDRANTDLDQDGIADEYDDSDGDSIPDRYDATPYGSGIDLVTHRANQLLKLKNLQ